MRKIIAAMNMTLDGFCDHTAMNADEEIHQHYSDALKNAGLLLYGRITYQLMESYWPEVVKNPTGDKSTDDFAVSIDRAQKIVFSHTLKSVSWKNTELKHELVREDILELKQQAGNDILVGSPGMIAAFTRLGLIDEYQIAIHPVILGSGLVLFKEIREKVDLKLIRTKQFKGGSVLHYYETVKK